MSPQTAPSSTLTSPKAPKLAKGKRHYPESQTELGNGKWTDEEHRRFLHALDLYGNCWKKVEEYVETRTCAQIRSHCQKYFRRLRNKTLQELKRANQLKGKVFIVTREYFNYSGFAHQPMEPEMRIASRQFTNQSNIQISESALKTAEEPRKDNCCDQGATPVFQQENELEPRFEIFEEPKIGNEFDEGLFGSRMGFCEDNNYSVFGQELPFKEEYDEYSMPFTARVSYEA